MLQRSLTWDVQSNSAVLVPSAAYQVNRSCLPTNLQHRPQFPWNIIAFLYDAVNIVEFVNVQKKFVTAVVIHYRN